MRRCAVLCAITALVAAPAWADEACRKEVATAFNKQRTSRVFTMASELKTPSGPVQIKVEYQPPDRMRQTIMAPNQEPSRPCFTASAPTAARAASGKS